MSVPERTGVPEKTSQTEQYVLNYSFDETFKLLMVGLAAYNPTTNTYDRVQIDNDTGGLTTAGGGSSGASSVKTSRIAIDGAIIYEGTAAPGTLESAAGWTITKTDTTDENNISATVALGATWDNRATETYT